MPRFYERKTNREIAEQDMKHAICAYLGREVGLNESARQHNVKRTTLQSRLKILLKNQTKEEVLASLEDSGNESEGEQDRAKKFGNKYAATKVFTVDQERELSKYLKHASNLNYGLSYKQVQKLAYQYARSIPDCRIPQQWIEKEEAGDEWRKGFMKRNQDLSLRKPESTSLLRGTGFNKSRVEEFFQNFTAALEKHGFNSQQIYNLDETGITTVMKPVKVVSSKGKKQVGQVASGERGELVTFVGIINATGSAVPPVFVYPRIRNPQQYLIDGPNGSLAFGNKSGWMTADLFLDVLRHIVNHTRCSKENKILLIVDNHASHTSVPAILFCRQNGIVLLSFPPHTTHRLQPLDVGIYSSFKTKLAVAFNDWMLSHPGRTISIRDISELANTAYLNSFTPKNIISSFKNTGIWPINRLIFTDEDFAPSSVTDIPIENIESTAAPEGNVEILEQDVLENEKTPERIVDDEEASENEGDEAMTSFLNDFPNKTRAASTPVKEPGTPRTREPVPSTSKESVPSTSKEPPPLKSKKSVPPMSEEPEPSTSKNTVPLTKRPSLEEIRPFPKIDSCKRKRKIRKVESKSRIYTDTPEYNIRLALEMERKRTGNVIKKKTVVKKVFEDSSSSSENSFVANDTSDDESFESLQALEQDVAFDINEFVLARFRKDKKKEGFCYYIGKILNVEEGVLTATFLRRRGLTTNFYFPTIPDISTLPITDVTAKLSAPVKIGTARVLASLRFNYNFQGYDLR